MVRGVRGSGARGNRNNPKTYKNDTTKQKPNAVSTDKTKETVNKPKHKKKFVRNGRIASPNLAFRLFWVLVLSSANSWTGCK